MKDLNKLTRIEILEKFTKLNTHIRPLRTGWRMDGRLEWFCKHHVGHTVFAPDGHFIHGCCGCCKQVNIPKEWERKDERKNIR